MILIPPLLLIISGFAILVIHQTQQRFRFAWLIAATGALLAWVSILVFNWFDFPPIQFPNWDPISYGSIEIVFELDWISWAFALSIASLLVAVILTSNARFQDQTNPTAWAGSLMIGGVSILAVLSNTPVTILFSWFILDIIELVFVIRNLKGETTLDRAITGFGFRILGTLLAIFSIAQAGSLAWRSFSTLKGQTVFLLLIAAGLRLGLIPLHLPYRNEIRLRWGYGSMLRLAVPISTLVILSRMPDVALSSRWNTIIIIITAASVLYSSFMWFSAEDEMEGRPYWLIVLAGFAMISVLNGKPEASMTWSLALILSGSMVFLYSSKYPGLLIIPILGISGFMAFPYTLSSNGWEGILHRPFNLVSLVFIMAHTLLLLGYIKHAVFTRENFTELDRWVQIVYSFGFVFPIAGILLIRTFGEFTNIGFEFWWASLISVIFFLLGGMVYHRDRFRKKKGDPEESERKWIGELLKKAGRVLGNIFNFEWAYRILQLFYRIIQEIVIFLNNILDGEGGILWAILLLAILLSFMSLGNLS